MPVSICTSCLAMRQPSAYICVPLEKVRLPLVHLGLDVPNLISRDTCRTGELIVGMVNSSSPLKEQNQRLRIILKDLCCYR